MAEPLCTLCGKHKPSVQTRGYGGRLYPSPRAAHRRYVVACLTCFNAMRAADAEV